ncbi:PREDICTED: repetin-like [Apaloderma vittatum]|uniref:repetin-like n=1 Tax=Apaloderma vittatum TaxID=57397 RepID=UPI000521C567|nr:PREDICTED: repetin-like [Apaloderma vittatum]
MAQFQDNIHGIVAAFYVCARSDGSCSPLSREELRQLIEQEFEEAMENPQDPKTIKKVRCFLDDDSDCWVDFSELLSLVFRVAKACSKPLQQLQEPEDGQEPTAQEKASEEQLPEPHIVGRGSHNQQVPMQGVNNQVQDSETQDPDNQGCGTSKQDPDTHETYMGETPEQDQDTHQTQEGETSKKDHDTHETQEEETAEQDPDNRQPQEGETKEENTHETREDEAPQQDQDTHQDEGAEEPEEDAETDEILDAASQEQDRNTHRAEEIETPKQDMKTHQAQETEAPGQGSNHFQSPEFESAEQDLNCSSETQGRDPDKTTQVCEAAWQDLAETQKLLPPQQGASPCRDLKPQGMRHELPFHRLAESEELEQELSGAEAPAHPAQQQQALWPQSQPAAEQQLLQALSQWPPQQ